jgi:hypothetical protein
LKVRGKLKTLGCNPPAGCDSDPCIVFLVAFQLIDCREPPGSRRAMSRLGNDGLGHDAVLHRFRI